MGLRVAVGLGVAVGAGLTAGTGVGGGADTVVGSVADADVAVDTSTDRAVLVGDVVGGLVDGGADGVIWHAVNAIRPRITRPVLKFFISHRSHSPGENNPDVRVPSPLCYSDIAELERVTSCSTPVIHSLPAESIRSRRGTAEGELVGIPWDFARHPCIYARLNTTSDLIRSRIESSWVSGRRLPCPRR